MNVGYRFKVKTFEGRAGNVVSRLSDGRVVLFGREHPYNRLVSPNQEVEVRVVKVHDNYVIVDAVAEGSPVKFQEPEEMPEVEDDSFIYELERTSEEGYGDTAIIARALLHIIRLQSLIIKRIDDLARNH